MPAFDLPRPAADSCLLFLIRHGATANNLANPPRLQGRSQDPELSDDGHAQAAAAGDVLAQESIAACYASPLRRAMQTAGAVAKEHGLEVNPVDALVECDVGNWEGRDWGEIERSEPEAYRNFMDDPATHPYVGGETFSQVSQRVMPALSEICGRHAGDSIVVVGHNIVNRCCITEALGLPLKLARQIHLNNAGISLLRFRGDRFKLLTLNSVFHLGPWVG